jgi:hypothetical protein
MHKSLCPLLVTLSLIVATPALVNAADELVVLSLASHNQVDDCESVGFVAKSPEMPTWLASTFKLYAEGRGAHGLDGSRPWGAVVFGGENLKAYAFIPVTDAESLSWELDEHIDSVTDLGGDIHKVVGTEEGTQLFAKEQGGWLFVSDRESCLQTVTYDPTKLLDEMNKEYDVAVRLVLKNIPADDGHKILAKLDKVMGPALRKMTSDETVEILGEAAFALEEVTLGWGG